MQLIRNCIRSHVITNINLTFCTFLDIIFIRVISVILEPVSIAFRESLDYKILSVTHDNNGRFIIIYTIIKGFPFILINYYAPNDENGQIQILSEIQEQLDILDSDQDTQIIWGGDFNVIFDTKLDADKGNPQLKLNSVTKLLSMIAGHDMCDI